MNRGKGEGAESPLIPHSPSIHLFLYISMTCEVFWFWEKVGKLIKSNNLGGVFTLFYPIQLCVFIRISRFTDFAPRVMIYHRVCHLYHTLHLWDMGMWGPRGYYGGDDGGILEGRGYILSPHNMLPKSNIYVTEL